MSGFLKFISKISIRLLVFNILLVFLPVAGFLFLDTYEEQLLKEQEGSMVQQGRILAAALSEKGALFHKYAKEILIRLNRKTDARLRIINPDGVLIADSSSIILPENKDLLSPVIPETKDTEPEKITEDDEKTDWLYDLATLPFRLYRRFFQPPLPILEESEFYSDEKIIMGQEVKAALEGKYKAVWRLSAGGQRSVTFFSALPIYNKENVIGAVLVSQSTYKILQNLYEVRLDIFKVFLVTVGAAIIISFILSGTIARPLRKLRNEAEAILDRRGRITRLFLHTKRKDEIGDLTSSLEELTIRLEKHISFIESFASDLSHEFKNPLASIRSAIEIVLETDNKKDREHFLNMALRDINRMERLLSGVREISRLDTSLKEEKRQIVHPNTLLTHLIESFRLHTEKVSFCLKTPETPIEMYISPERFAQVCENLLDNAISFSPENGIVEVSLHKENDHIIINVMDEGPGIPVENIENIFDRFFSFRQGKGKKEEHTGLGLSIVKVIVEGYGGSITAKNREKKGALFIVKLPVKSI
ncbi:MAG: sensor N-terminal transmembrane domain-containing protein [Spirochaetales bacterium]|nr:sensor N-terminal transmembrane domain-containing protein [Spirochaetales bacterium]